MKQEFVTVYGKAIIERDKLYIRTLNIPFSETAFASVYFCHEGSFHVFRKLIAKMNNHTTFFFSISNIYFFINIYEEVDLVLHLNGMQCFNNLHTFIACFVF